MGLQPKRYSATDPLEEQWEDTLISPVLIIILFFLLGFSFGDLWEIVAHMIRSRRKRNLHLTIIVDNDLFTSPTWGNTKKRIEKALENATDVFKENFNIQFLLSETFVFSFSPPLVKPSIDTDEYFKDLSSQKNIFDDDVLLTVTDKTLHGFYSTDNNVKAPYTDAPGVGSTAGMVIVSLIDDETCDLDLWCHELAHVFGAKHSMDQASVMRPRLLPNPPPIYFDPINKKIIYQNKFKRFSKKFP